MSNRDEKIMLEMRARARRSVQGIFAALALGALAFGLYIHLNPSFAGLNPAETTALANAFLFLGTANALTMWVWDFLFWPDLEIE